MRKKYLCSFIGSNTHPYRQKIHDAFKDEKDFLVTFDKLPHKEYLQIINNSTFTLCPRGRKRTPQRFFDALSLSSVPIYLHDEYFLPFEEKFWTDKIILQNHVQDLSALPTFLRAFPQGLVEMFVKNIENSHHLFDIKTVEKYTA